MCHPQCQAVMCNAFDRPSTLRARAPTSPSSTSHRRRRTLRRRRPSWQRRGAAPLSLCRGRPAGCACRAACSECLPQRQENACLSITSVACTNSNEAASSIRPCCPPPQFCHEAVQKVVSDLGCIDILVNNVSRCNLMVSMLLYRTHDSQASQQHYHDDITEVTEQELVNTAEGLTRALPIMAALCGAMTAPWRWRWLVYKGDLTNTAPPPAVMASCLLCLER